MFLYFFIYFYIFLTKFLLLSGELNCTCEVMYDTLTFRQLKKSYLHYFSQVEKDCIGGKGRIRDVKACLELVKEGKLKRVQGFRRHGRVGKAFQKVNIQKGV
jgi:hypothetical protein